MLDFLIVWLYSSVWILFFFLTTCTYLRNDCIFGNWIYWQQTIFPIYTPFRRWTLILSGILQLFGHFLLLLLQQTWKKKKKSSHGDEIMCNTEGWDRDLRLLLILRGWKRIWVNIWLIWRSSPKKNGLTYIFSEPLLSHSTWWLPPKDYHHRGSWSEKPKNICERWENAWGRPRRNYSHFARGSSRPLVNLMRITAE